MSRTTPNTRSRSSGRVASIHPAAPANINLIILNSSEWLSQHPAGEFQTHFGGIGSQGRQAPNSARTAPALPTGKPQFDTSRSIEQDVRGALPLGSATASTSAPSASSPTEATYPETLGWTAASTSNATVLAGVAMSMSIAREGVFGPIQSSGGRTSRRCSTTSTRSSAA